MAAGLALETLQSFPQLSSAVAYRVSANFNRENPDSVGAHCEFLHAGYRSKSPLHTVFLYFSHRPVHGLWEDARGSGRPRTRRMPRRHVGGARAADEGAEDTRKPARQDPGADQDAGREVGPAQGPDESWTMCAKASFVEATEELGLALDC
jgi:hypothetical protein